MQDPDKNRRVVSRLMNYGFWIVLLAVLTVFFKDKLATRYNPNQELASLTPHASQEVTLQRNAYGHYIAPGLLNNTAATFLLDTGATTISIPQAVADSMSLSPRGYSTVSTANGSIKVARVILDSVSLGGITLRRVPAHINPFMEGETVLLGMSFLRHLEITQRGNTLTLRQ